MITLYTWKTPNGRKVSIMLEELGVPYELKTVDLGKDEQFHPDFLKISPNNKIPAIVDHDADGGPLALFESGAILIYLAEKYGRFLPLLPHDRYTCIQWLMWQMGGVGPMTGQLGWFAKAAPEPNPMALERYSKEVERLLTVADKRLSESAFLAGDDYTIADIATYPWLQRYRVYVKDYIEPMIQARPYLSAWLDTIGRREAVQRGLLVPS